MAGAATTVAGAESVCQCHSLRETPNCPLDQNQTRLAFLGPSCTLEIEIAKVEELAQTSIRCQLCKSDLGTTLRHLVNYANLSIPIELKVDEEADLYLLRAETVGTTKKLVLSNIRDINDVTIPPASFIMDSIFGFLGGQADGGVYPAGTSDSEIESLIQGFSDICTAGSLQEAHQAIEFAKQIEYLYDAVIVGYFFLRLYRPQQVTSDILTLINRHRQDQSDFFLHLVEYVKYCVSSADPAWSSVLPKLIQCFKQSLFIFQNAQVMDALKFGIRLYSPFTADVQDSFMFSSLGRVFPLVRFTEFFLGLRSNNTPMTAVPSYLADLTSIVQSYLIADATAAIASNYEALSGFSGGLLSKESRGFIMPVEKLIPILRCENGQVTRFVQRSEVGEMFGVGSVNENVLEEAARHFWHPLADGHHLKLRSTLEAFLCKISGPVGDPWLIVQQHIEALFSVKIGMYAYGELDFILGRCQHVGACLYPWGSRAINRVLSHVVSRVAPDHAVSRPIPRINHLHPARSRMGSGLDESTLSGPHSARLMRGRVGIDDIRPAAVRVGGIRGSIGAEEFSPYTPSSPGVGARHSHIFATGGSVVRTSTDEYSAFDSFDDDDSASWVSSGYRMRHYSSASATVVTDRRLSASPPARPMTVNGLVGSLPYGSHNDGMYPQMSPPPQSPNIAYGQFYGTMPDVGDPNSAYSPLFFEMKQSDAYEDWSSNDPRSSHMSKRVPGFNGQANPNRSGTSKKEPLMQFHETWTTKTTCVVRLPAAFYQFIVESHILQEIADKAGAHIDVVRMGKILVAASAFRFEAATREATVLAVSALHNFLCNLGLCEKRFKVTKKIAARVVGKGGERIATLRSRSKCKIFVSDVENDGVDDSGEHTGIAKPSYMQNVSQPRLSWIILLGKPEAVAEAHKLMRPYLDEQNFGPRSALSRASNSVTASWSSIDEDDLNARHGSVSGTLGPTSIRALRTSFTSDADAYEVFASGSSVDVSSFKVSMNDGISPPISRRTLQQQSNSIQSGDASIPVKTIVEDALFKAIQHRQWSTATELISRNEGVKFVAPSGTSVLHKAAERNAPENIINSLLECGLDPNQTVAKKGFISLHYAVQSNSAPSLALTLINAGANINHQDEQGFAPLHLAAQRNVSPKLVEVLLQNKADVALRDKSGATALDVARTSRASPEIIQMLERTSNAAD